VTEGLCLLRPDWDLPAGVHAFFTTRAGGCSLPPYASFNLGQHVGDDPQAVAANRQHLQAELGRATGWRAPEIQWMRQVHGTRVHLAGRHLHMPAPEADALHANAPGLALGVLTADCLPVLFCTDDGREIAAAHAGWRGLLNGVLEATLASFTAAPASISTWLGPAIGSCHFEVGPEVRNAFLQAASTGEEAATLAAFRPSRQPDKWFGDLPDLARLRLLRSGVNLVAGSSVCTVCAQDSFYSFRAQQITGRFASLIMKTV